MKEDASLATSPYQEPSLYIIPTPVGNMKDITLRALEVLAEVDLLLCEDTRRTRKLLSYHQIPCPSLVRFDAYREESQASRVLDLLKGGEKRIGLVCDAGTPGICDVAYSLTHKLYQEGLHATCLPGATALIPALVSSGLPPIPFHFEGFLPKKKGRNHRWAYLSKQAHTCVLYESKHRLLRTLREMEETFGEEKGWLSVCCELSKRHEAVHRGRIHEIISHFEAHPPRGEFVLVYYPS